MFEEFGYLKLWIGFGMLKTLDLLTLPIHYFQYCDVIGVLLLLSIYHPHLFFNSLHIFFSSSRFSYKIFQYLLARTRG